MKRTGLAVCGAVMMLLVGVAAAEPDTTPPETDAQAAAPRSPRQARSLADAQAHKAGVYTIKQAGVDPGRFAALTERLKVELEDGPTLARDELARWDAARGLEGWRVRVPENYDRQSPHGLVVFVNTDADGGVPRGWDKVLDARRLIWIGPEEAGDEVMIVWRMAKALEAVALAQQRYNLEKNRVYIAGFSGGGRLASVIAPNFADYFAGGLFICGCNPLDDTAVAGRKHLDRAKRGRYAFLTGEGDFNRDQTRAVAKGYRAAGFRSVAYFEAPGMAHELPDAEWLNKALAALDAPYVEAARRLYQRARRYDKAGRRGAAIEPYAEAARLGFAADFALAASKRRAELSQAYAQAVAAVETHLDAGAADAAQEALIELRRTWMPPAREDAARLSRAIMELRRAERK